MHVLFGHPGSTFDAGLQMPSLQDPGYLSAAAHWTGVLTAVLVSSAGRPYERIGESKRDVEEKVANKCCFVGRPLMVRTSRHHAIQCNFSRWLRRVRYMDLSVHFCIHTYATIIF